MQPESLHPYFPGPVRHVLSDIYRRESFYQGPTHRLCSNRLCILAILRIYLDFLKGYNRLYQLKEEFMKLKKASSIFNQNYIGRSHVLTFYSMLPAINLREISLFISFLRIVIFWRSTFLTYVRILSRISVPAGVWNSPEIL